MRIGRLRRRSEFLRVARSGRNCPTKGLVLQARTCAADSRHVDRDADMWFGITVSRRVGKSVERNRVRRRLRALARLMLPNVAAPYHDYVLIGRRATLTRPYAALLSDLEYALHRVNAYHPVSELTEPSIKS